MAIHDALFPFSCAHAKTLCHATEESRCDPLLISVPHDPWKFQLMKGSHGFPGGIRRTLQEDGHHRLSFQFAVNSCEIMKAARKRVDARLIVFALRLLLNFKGDFCVFIKSCEDRTAALVEDRQRFLGNLTARNIPSLCR